MEACGHFRTLFRCWHLGKWWWESVVPCLPGVGEPPFLFAHCVSFWEGAKAGGIFGFGTVGV